MTKAKDDVLKLTNEEKLTIQLAATRKQLLQTQLAAQVAQIDGGTQPIIEAIEKRLSIKLADYQVDLESGEVRKTPQPGATPQDAAPQAETPSAA